MSFRLAAKKGQAAQFVEIEVV